MTQAREATKTVEPLPDRTKQEEKQPNDKVRLHPFLDLQRAAGNQAVLRLLESQSQFQTNPEHNQSRALHFSLRSASIQTKLAISQPNDPAEREADSISQQVVRSPQLQRHVLAQTHRHELSGTRFGVQRKSLAVSSPTDAAEKEADEVARTVVNGQAAPVRENRRTVNPKNEDPAETPPDFQASLESSTGGGESLDDSTRTEMESKIGADFSNVKVYTGREAQDMSERINAKAFTHGQNIYFKAGQYNPASNNGKELLAHELAHVKQQSNKANEKIQRQADPNAPKSQDKSKEVTKDYKPATTFSELVELVRAAETKLKAVGQDVKTRIKTLRGLHYGTTWSFDFVKAEGSAMRNVAFTYFLYGRSAMETANNAYQKLFGDLDKLKPAPEFVPMNPEVILGPKLCDAIRNSYEVTNSDGRKVDVGHLIIGLEARLSKDKSQERQQLADPRDVTNVFTPPKPMGGTGLELTTWVGDLGGGTALLAQKRVVAPKTDAKIAFQDQHSYGALVNLEGDVAAFVVGLPEKSTTPYGLVIDETTGIAGALEAYLSPAKAGDKWNNRAKKFLSLYGGKFDANNDLINKSSILPGFVDKLKNFAYVYKETRLKDEANKKQSTNKLTEEQQAKVDEQMKLIAAKIPAAATEVATLFIDALSKTAKDPSRGIAP